MRDYGEELLSGKAASPPPEKAAKPKRDWGEELLSAKTNPVSINPTSPRRQEFVSQRPFTDDPAGAGTAMLSGTVEDVDSKIALFAKNRFLRNYFYFFSLRSFICIPKIFSLIVFLIISF